MLPSADPNGERLRSVDAYRGFVMLALVSGGIATFGGPPDSDSGELSIPLELLLRQFDHVQWRGGVFWDLIQPSFMFLVGVSMPFSFNRRRARGDEWLRLFGHAIARSLILIGLGVFLASHGRMQTNYSFTNVLAQIGLGYTFVFLLLGRPPAVQLTAALLLLIAYWLLFALWPVTDPRYLSGVYGVNEPQLTMNRFFAHWNKNANVAASFDRWFLNLFPRFSNAPFKFDPEGYATLNFVPSIATMTFGVLAGETLLSHPRRVSKAQILLFAGVVFWLLGQVLDATVCPIVKRIWTPSWVIASTAWSCWMLAAFYWVIDVHGYKLWSLPLAAVGANPILIYLMAQLMKPFVVDSLRTHYGRDVFAGPNGALLQGLCVMAVLWLVSLWLYRRRIFIKI
jgi:heparan-alpha-glucosaminide N-acetyltransferase